MKKPLFSVLTIISFLALLGITFTQIFWVRRAINLRESQFKSEINLSIKGIANRIFDYQLGVSPDVYSPCDTALYGTKTFLEIINPKLLDSLVRNEFNEMTVGKDFEYAVYNQQDSNFITGVYVNYKEELMESGHQINLTCLYQPDIYMFSVYFPHEKGIVIQSMIFWLIISLVFILIVFFSFFSIIHHLLKQKNISEMKSDFINNMTHEFKTPISTISLAGEMLQKENIYNDPGKVRKYAKVVMAENVRMQSQVDQILHLATSEKDLVKLRKKEINTHEILETLIDHFDIKIREKNGNFRVQLNAQKYLINADQHHFINIVSNLIDNAIKYSNDNAEITIHTCNYNDGISISIRDNGIGISKDDQKHIFKKLYRVPTGNRHDVSGFGIGLHYVKLMTEAHGGRIKLRSNLNKGSTFIVQLPFNYKEDEKIKQA